MSITPSSLDRAWIEAHIPHHGRMCLLDEVITWSPDRIRCRSSGHRAPDHPLRAHGRLGIVCGIEFAAQAMAVHAALTADRAASRPRAGLLASVRSVRLYVSRLDDVETDLICDAVRLAADRGTALYEFTLRSATSPLLSGRAAVVLDAGARRSA
jgi:predicted hotdog family 3-hydroxylacyl-ACP dehydratase